MAKGASDPTAAFTRNWAAVTRDADPAAFRAWFEFRCDVLGTTVDSNKGLHVPSELPPTTLAGVGDYVSAIKEIRRAIGWQPNARGHYAKARPAPVDYGEAPPKRRMADIVSLKVLA